MHSAWTAAVMECIIQFHVIGVKLSEPPMKRYINACNIYTGYYVCIGGTSIIRALLHSKYLLGCMLCFVLKSLSAQKQLSA